MSNADPEEVSVAVERHGISVQKSFEPDDFPVPAIAFVIRSVRDESVEVVISDNVPDDIEAEDIGFHPKYGADFWRNEDGRLVFEREFEAGEEYTTVYGLRSRDTDDVGRFLGDPEIERVHPEPEGDPGQVVSDVMNEGQTLDLRDPSTEPAEASDDDLEAAIAAADVGSGGDLEAAVQAAESTTEETTAATEDVDVDVVGALAAELRAGSVSEDDIETLRQALGVEDTPGSVDARLTHLQTEVSDLKAYTTALEGFLDENGDTQELLQDLRGSIEDLESGLSTIRSDADEAKMTASEADAAVSAMTEEVEAIRSEVQSLDDRYGNVTEEVTEVRNSVQSTTSELNSVKDEVDGVGRDIETVEAEMSEVQEGVESVRTEVSDVTADVDDVQDTVGSVREDVDTVSGDVDAVEGEMDSVKDGLDELRGEVEAVREDIPTGELDGLDERVSDIDDRIADLEAEIEGLAQMREQMASVFGGAAAQQVEAKAEAEAEAESEAETEDDGED